MRSTQYHFSWLHPSIVQRFRLGLSLHSHTIHSREGLDFVQRIARTIPVLRDIVAYEERRYERRNGCPLDYSRTYWQPPLPEGEAFLLEQRQLEALGLNSIVSLTDHDNIEASKRLGLFEESRTAPVSVEWTVPYGPSFFHLGVHNLPRESAGMWMESLAEYTARPEPRLLRGLLAALDDQRDVLVVFNHPFWDEKGIGPQAHQEIVTSFLKEFGCWLHAIEFNGLRPWPENQAAIALAETAGLCVVSGGDRHASDPNAVLNLSNAGSFAEFADEVRQEGISDVLILPRYREPFRLRCAEAIWDIVREYPEHAGRVRWTERVFYRTTTGEYASLSSAWGGDGPAVVGTFMAVVRILSSPHVRPTLRMALKTKGEVLS
jgi:hypothetical protein